MIEKLTVTSLRHRALVVMAMVLFLFAGINAYRELPVEAYPDVTNVSFQVVTLFPGHAAEEVERLVTIPLESSLNGIPHRLYIRSISLFGLSQITLVFEDGTDNGMVRNLASQLIGTVNLPPGAQANLSPDATAIGEIYRYTLRAPEGFPAVELRALEDWVVEKKFRTVPGVVDINPFGGLTKQYQVLVDPAQLKSYNVTLQQVLNALSSGNANAQRRRFLCGTRLGIIRRARPGVDPRHG
jgi:cobalt-zinc-cadmium resistance protein CzcA